MSAADPETANGVRRDDDDGATPEPSRWHALAALRRVKSDEWIDVTAEEVALRAPEVE